MRNNRTARWLIAGLWLFAVIAVTTRHQIRKRQALTPGNTVWRLRYDVGFVTTKPNARISLAVPVDTEQLRLIRQELSHAGLRVVLQRGKITQDIELGCSARIPGTYRILAQYDVHMQSGSERVVASSSASLDTLTTAHYLSSSPVIQAGSPDVLRILAQIRGRDKLKKKDVVERIFRHCRAEIITVEQRAPDDALTALNTGVASSLGQANAMVALCRAATSRLRQPRRRQHGRVAPCLRTPWAPSSAPRSCA